MKTLSDRIDSWIFREYAPAVGGLPLYRIFFALLLLVYYLPLYAHAGLLPATFFDPGPSLALFFPGFLPQGIFYALDYLVALGGFCLLFGYRTRLASLFLAASVIFINSFSYATGKVNHDILIPVALFSLAWSDWGRRYSSDAARLAIAPRFRAPVWPLALLVFMLGLVMLTAAVTKAKSGWLNPGMECCRGHLLLNYVGADRPKLLAEYMAGIDSRLFWKAIDYSTVLLEGGFIIALLWLPAMRFICAAACTFHASIYLSMNIFFFANPAAYASLLDLRFLLRHQRARAFLRGFTRLAGRMKFLHLALLAALWDGLGLAVDAVQLRSSVPFLTGSAFLLMAVGAWASAAILLRGTDRLSGRRTSAQG